MVDIEKKSVDKVNAFYKALNSNDIKAIEIILSRDVEFTYPLSLPYGLQAWKGLEGVKESMSAMFTYLGFTEWQPKNVYTSANNVWCSGMFRIGAFSIMFCDLFVFDVQNQQIKQRIHFIDTALVLDCFTENFID